MLLEILNEWYESGRDRRNALIFSDEEFPLMTMDNILDEIRLITECDMADNVNFKFQQMLEKKITNWVKDSRPEMLNELMKRVINFVSHQIAMRRFGEDKLAPASFGVPASLEEGEDDISNIEGTIVEFIQEIEITSEIAEESDMEEGGEDLEATMLQLIQEEEIMTEMIQETDKGEDLDENQKMSVASDASDASEASDISYRQQLTVEEQVELKLIQKKDKQKLEEEQKIIIKEDIEGVEDDVLQIELKELEELEESEELEELKELEDRGETEEITETTAQMEYEAEEVIEVDAQLLNVSHDVVIMPHAPDMVCCASLKAWSTWIKEVAENAKLWCSWINQTIMKIRKMAIVLGGRAIDDSDSPTPSFTIDDWYDFIRKFDEDIVAWRHYNMHVQTLTTDIKNHFHDKRVACCEYCAKQNFVLSEVGMEHLCQQLHEALDTTQYWRKWLHDMIGEAQSLTQLIERNSRTTDIVESVLSTEVDPRAIENKKLDQKTKFVSPSMYSIERIDFDKTK